MRLVVDTNVLISALLGSTSLPAHLIVLWREGKFDLLTSAEQLDELMRVSRYPKIRGCVAPALAGRPMLTLFLNGLRRGVGWFARLGKRSSLSGSTWKFKGEINLVTFRIRFKL